MNLNATSSSVETSAEDVTTSPLTPPRRAFKCAGGGRPPGPGFASATAPIAGGTLSPRKRSEDSL